MLLSENKSLLDQLSALKLHVENLDQYNRNKNVEIDGVPEVPNEKIENIVSKLSNMVGVNICPEADVQAVHRVPTKRKSGIKPIILQFSNRQKRNLFLQKSKGIQIKSTDFVSNVPQTTVYVNEHLSPSNKELLYRAKQLKENGYQFVWPKDGKIFVRKNSSRNEKTIQIISAADVDKLLNKS